MIPSINALTTAVLFLKGQENKYRMQSHVYDTIDNDPELAAKAANVAHDFFQVIMALEVQIESRKIAYESGNTPTPTESQQ